MTIDCRGAAIWMQACPVVRAHDELDSDQAKRATGKRFVNQRLGLVRIEHAIANSTGQNEVHTHGALVRSTHARCTWHPSFGGRDVDITIAGGGAAHLINEWAEAAAI